MNSSLILLATRGKKSSLTKSANSEGTIEITKSEEQKQDISKINKNTKDDNTNALKDEFDPKKIAERQELASLFGELGANAILKAVGEAKGSSASVQWATAVIGAALSTATDADAK